jgi:NADH-quinone oxidoreductase subunit J
MDVIVFLFFALVAVGCGINVVVQRHPITSAISLIGVMGSLAVLYLLLGGEFIAASQVVVYAGAIMVLFIFVIMLLNAGTEPAGGRSWPVRLLGIPALVLFIVLLGSVLLRVASDEKVAFGSFTQGGPGQIGRLLFSEYLLPFEATSVLILVAIVGAVALARKELD